MKKRLKVPTTTVNNNEEEENGTMISQTRFPTVKEEECSASQMERGTNADDMVLGNDDSSLKLFLFILIVSIYFNCFYFIHMLFVLLFLFYSQVVSFVSILFRYRFSYSHVVHFIFCILFSLSINSFKVNN